MLPGGAELQLTIVRSRYSASAVVFVDDRARGYSDTTSHARARSRVGKLRPPAVFKEVRGLSPATFGRRRGAIWTNRVGGPLAELGKTSVSQPNGFCHSSPAMFLLAFESPQVDAGHRQGAVIQEPGRVLDQRPGVSPKLHRVVSKDVKTDGRVKWSCTMIARISGAASARVPCPGAIERQGESVDPRSNLNRRLCVAVLFVSVLLVGAIAAGCGGSSTITTTSPPYTTTTAAQPSTTTAVQPSSTTTVSTEAQTTAASVTTTPGPSTTAAQSSQGQLTYGANTLAYAAPVTADQAQKLLDYLASTFSWDKTSPTGMSFAIAKTGTVYELAMVIRRARRPTRPSLRAQRP